MVKKGYKTIKQASEYLGISRNTLRRWDQKGKLKAYRHPNNNYRLYRRQDLKKILNQRSEK